MDKEVWCMNLKFHLEEFEFMMILSFMWTKKLTMCLPLPPFFSLTIPKRQYKKEKKATETSHKKFSEGKQVHVGMEASKTNQTRWEWHHNTFTPSLHLVPFCQLHTPQNSPHAL